MDDNFLRQAAALQANLKMLESQSASLTDLADMKELRQFKARLADYIDGHAAAGNLPRDPFQVIEGRLRGLEDFFSETTRETKQLTSWRKDWLKAAPSLDLATLQGSLGELDAIMAEVPRIQESLRAKISAPDWVVGSHAAELHPELLICAQLVQPSLPVENQTRDEVVSAGGIILPSSRADTDEPVSIALDTGGIVMPSTKSRRVRAGLINGVIPGLDLLDPARRQAAYEFTHGSGTLTEEVAKHFRAVEAKIREWMSLHATHASELAQITQDVENQQIRSAERHWGALSGIRFADLNYTSAEFGVKELNAIFQRFASCKEQLDGRMTKGEFLAVEKKFVDLAHSISNPDSELGREALKLLGEMKSIVMIGKAARRKRRIRAGIFAAFVVAALAAAGIQIQNEARTEEGVAAKLKANVENAAAELESKENANRAGEEHEFEIAPGVRMSFCWCPAGEFMMGSAASEQNRATYENQVTVTLSKGFWMGKTEVTQGQWQAVMGGNPSKFKGASRPVENVSWNDAQQFLEKLNARLGNADGGNMFLPTEAQWEYAARARQKEIYAGGSLDEVAWYDGNSRNETHPVSTKKANAWGLHDMSGNVLEWCQDWYDGELPGGSDPNGPDSGPYRVFRGGSWSSNAANCLVALRISRIPTILGNDIGFRVVRSSVP